MATGIAIAALAVSIVSAVAAFLSWRASSRSAAAAEAADRRAREPQLTILLDNPAPAPVDRVIYHVRNEGPQDLDSIVIYRPLPPDKIVYHIAVTGENSGWMDEIDLGPMSLTEEGRFTLSCGSARDLPDFRVRIECKAGSDRWPLSRVLPPPRGKPLSEEEISSRNKILSAALEEIERNITTAQSDNWYRVPLEIEHLRTAHRLLREHAPDWIGPVRDAVQGVTDFRVWAEQSEGTTVGMELTERREGLLRRLSEANAELEKMRAALKPPGVPDRQWRS
jgi:hypothetical protein